MADFKTVSTLLEQNVEFGHMCLAVLTCPDTVFTVSFSSQYNNWYTYLFENVPNVYCNICKVKTVMFKICKEMMSI